MWYAERDRRAQPFLTHFWSQNGPFSRYFGIFHGPKRATTGSKRPKNTCLSIPSGLGTTLGKTIFFAPGTLVHPPLAPAVRRLGCPLAPPSDHWYGGLGGLLGDSEAWKPQKVGVCGWTRCPRNSDLSNVAQDTVRSWFRGVGAHGADFGAFWRLFGPFLGHIVELGGNKELLVTVKSSRTCSVATVCLRLAVMTGFGGRFGPKKAVLGHKMRSFGRAPPDLAPPPRLKTLVCTPPMVKDHFFARHVFDPFFTHFWSQNGPFSRHFGIFHGPKRVPMGSKLAKNTCLSIASGLGTTLEEMIFFAPGTLVDPPLAPTGPRCPPAPPSDHLYGGPGVSLGDSEAWKPQKVGGCGWNRCPRNSDLSHVAQDTTRSPFWGCLTQTAHIQGHFQPFLGRSSDISWS